MAGENIKGLTIPIGVDSSKFDREIKKVEGKIRGLNNQTNELEKSLKLEFDSDRFAEAQKIAQRAIDETEKKAKALRDQLQYMKENGGDIESAQYQKLQSQLIRTEADAVVLKKRLQEINNIKLEQVTKAFTNFGDTMSKASKALMPFSIAASGVIAGITTLGITSAKTVAKIDDLAQSFNLSAVNMQKWGYVVNQLGGDATVLEQSMTKVQKGLSQMAKGEVSSITVALANLGLTSADLSKGMDENFNQILASLSKIQDPLLQAAYANEIFGDRIGNKVVPMLKAGTEGVETMIKEFEELGYLTNEQVANMANFDDSVYRVKYQMQLVTQQLSEALIPMLEVLMSIVTEKIVPAIQAVADKFGSMSEGTQKFILAALGIVAVAAPLLGVVAKMSTGIGALIKGIHGIKGALMSVQSIPIVAVIAAVIALLIIMAQRNEKLKESLMKIVDILIGALQPAFELISNVITILMELLSPLLDMLAGILVPILDVLSTVLEVVVNVLMIQLKPAMVMIQVVLKLIMALLKPFMALFEVLGTVLSAFGQMVTSIFTPVMDYINKFMSWLEGIINSAIDFVNSLIDKVNKALGWMGVKVGKIGNISLTGGNKVDEVVEDKNTNNSLATEAITNTADNSSNIYNNSNVTDNSTKNVSINVVVENYAAEVDTDALIRDINIKLAAQM